MPSSTILLLVLVVLVFAAIFLKKVVLRPKSVSAEQEGALPAHLYRAADALLTPAERSFLGILDALTLPGIRICPKVRVADLVLVRGGLDNSTRTTAQNKVNSKHVDFALVQADTMTPVLVIELDDASHQRADRKTRDAFLDGVFDSAGIPILHLPAQRAYTIAEIRDAIASRLPDEHGVKAGNEVTAATSPAMRPSNLGTNLGKCPRCGADLVRRVPRSGGAAFIGCSSYPKCRHTQPIEGEPANPPA